MPWASSHDANRFSDCVSATGLSSETKFVHFNGEWDFLNRVRAVLNNGGSDRDVLAAFNLIS